MAPVLGRNESEGRNKGRAFPGLNIYLPLNGTSTTHFFLDIVSEGTRKDLEKRKDISCEKLYGLNEKVGILNQEDGVSYLHIINLSKNIETFMDANGVCINKEVLDHECELNWLRKFDYEMFLEIDLVWMDLTNCRYNPMDERYKVYEQEQEIMSRVQRLEITEMNPEDIAHINTRVKNHIRRRLNILKCCYYSPLMQEFLRKLDISCKDNNDGIEDFVSYLFTLHKSFAAFDFVKGTILKMFSGDQRKRIERTSTWSEFIECVSFEKEKFFTDWFEKEVLPDISDRSKFTRIISEPKRNSVLFKTAFRKLKDYRNYLMKFQNTFGKSFLIYFLLHTQLKDLVGILIRGQLYNDEARKDGNLTHLLKIREPTELMSLTKDRDEGLVNYLEQLIEYESLYTKIGIDADREDGPTMLPKILLSSLPCYSDTKVESTSEWNIDIPNKLLKKADKLHILEIYVKIEKLENLKTGSLYLSFKECEVIDRYSKESIGVQALSLIEKGRLIRPIPGKPVSNKSATKKLQEKKGAFRGRR